MISIRSTIIHYFTQSGPLSFKKKKKQKQRQLKKVVTPDSLLQSLPRKAISQIAVLRVAIIPFASGEMEISPAATSKTKTKQIYNNDIKIHFWDELLPLVFRMLASFLVRALWLRWYYKCAGDIWGGF